MVTPDDLADGADEYLRAARKLEPDSLRVAFEAYRHAAELAAKAILLRKTGKFPRDHAVAGPLAKAGGLPANVDGSRLHNLLSRFTFGTYDFDSIILKADVLDAKRLAERMVAACRNP